HLQPGTLHSCRVAPQRHARSVIQRQRLVDGIVAPLEIGGVAAWHVPLEYAAVVTPGETDVSRAHRARHLAGVFHARTIGTQADGRVPPSNRPVGSPRDQLVSPPRA